MIFFLKKYGQVWLVGFTYVFVKNYDWGLCATKNMYKMCSLWLLFKSDFYLKIHQNNLFFKKIIFDTNTLKWFENTKKLI
jgi:hypothetical protein